MKQALYLDSEKQAKSIVDAAQEEATRIKAQVEKQATNIAALLQQ